MRVLVAPDKLKGSLTAAAAAAVIARAARAISAEVEVERCPVADGGEGTLEALGPAVGAEERRVSVLGPHAREVSARFGFVPALGLAIVESADVVGLGHLAASERNPTRTTSFGLGQLLSAALDAGARKIVVGLGGSCTTDGGAGMARALGVVFDGVDALIRGGDVARIVGVDVSGIDPRIRETEIIAACDVDNPLTGPDGAALVYGEQKGASADEARELDAALRHLAALLPDSQPDAPRAGAAGGLGFGLATFLKASLVRGADSVLDALGFDERVARSDLVITAEGRLDGQSAHGKAVAAVAERCHRAGVPCVAIAGSVQLDATETRSLGLSAAFSLCSAPISEAEAMQHAGELLGDRAAQIIGLFLAAHQRRER